MEHTGLPGYLGWIFGFVAAFIGSLLFGLVVGIVAGLIAIATGQWDDGRAIAAVIVVTFFGSFAVVCGAYLADAYAKRRSRVAGESGNV